jgi:hypothetical protein
MRICRFVSCILWLSVGVSSAAMAQGSARVDPFNSGIVALGRLGPGLARRVVGDRTLSGLERAPRSQASDRDNTGGERGALIGGITGAIAGGVGFAHITHRNGGALNNGTGTLGGAVVGAGLGGGLGALVGFLIGSATSH